MTKTALISLLAVVPALAGDYHYGAFVGLKAPQKELKALTNSAPGTSVGAFVSKEIIPAHSIRVSGGYDFYPQYTQYFSYYTTTTKTGSWVLNADYVLDINPHFYAYAGVGMKRWTHDFKQVHTRDLFYLGVKHDVYKANKPFAHIGVGFNYKYFGLEVGYTEGRIAEYTKAQSIDGRFLVRF